MIQTQSVWKSQVLPCVYASHFFPFPKTKVIQKITFKIENICFSKNIYQIIYFKLYFVLLSVKRSEKVRVVVVDGFCQCRGDRDDEKYFLFVSFFCLLNWFNMRHQEFQICNEHTCCSIFDSIPNSDFIPYNTRERSRL